LNQSPTVKKNNFFEFNSNSLRILNFLGSSHLLKNLKNNVFSEKVYALPKIIVTPLKNIATPIKTRAKELVFSRLIVNRKNYSVRSSSKKKIFKNVKFSAHSSRRIYYKRKVFLKKLFKSNNTQETSENDKGVVSQRYKLSNIRKIPNEIKLHFNSEFYRFLDNKFSFRKIIYLRNAQLGSKSYNFIRRVIGFKKRKFKKKKI